MEATQHPLSKCDVFEAQWGGEQQAQQPKHQSEVMATLNGAKVAQAQRVDDWYKRVMHSITTTYILNGHKNDDDDEGDVGKDTCGRSMMDWCVHLNERCDELFCKWQKRHTTCVSVHKEGDGHWCLLKREVMK